MPVLVVHSNHYCRFVFIASNNSLCLFFFFLLYYSRFQPVQYIFVCTENRNDYWQAQMWYWQRRYMYAFIKMHFHFHFWPVAFIENHLHHHHRRFDISFEFDSKLCLSWFRCKKKQTVFCLWPSMLVRVDGSWWWMYCTALHCIMHRNLLRHCSSSFSTTSWVFLIEKLSWLFP